MSAQKSPLSVMDSKLKEALAGIKKGEPHVHLEGTVDLDLLQSLTKKHDIDLNSPSIFPNGREISPPPKAVDKNFSLSSFEDFISIYVKIVDSIRDTEDILLIAENYLRSARQQNIVCSDMYFSPTTYLLLERDLDPLYEGLLEAQHLARENYQSEIKWIFDIVRNTSVPPETTIECALAARARGVDVFAIGLAGYEKDYPPKPFAEAFEKARAEGFLTLAHAGETAGADYIWETLKLLKPSRIGHGVSALEDPALVEELVKKEIPVEVCPWSNILLGLFEKDNHPLPEMLDSGMQILLGSDDPGIFGKTLVENYLLAAELGIEEEVLLKIARQTLPL